MIRYWLLQPGYKITDKVIHIKLLTYISLHFLIRIDYQLHGPKALVGTDLKLILSNYSFTDEKAIGMLRDGL